MPAPQLEFPRLDRCRVCGSQELAPWRKRCRDTSGTTDRRFSYVRCTSCSVALLADGPPAEAAGAFYPSEYAPYVRPSPAVEDMFRLASSSDPVKAAQKSVYARPPVDGRLLDYGCGSPATLDAARAAGWHTTGVDFSPAVVEAVRGAGHEAHLADGFWSGGPGEFHLIRGNHVIEHVYDPPALLRSMLAALAPGGVLHLATPHPFGVGSAVFRSSWFSLDAPRHVVLFPPAVLARLLHEAGADEVRVVHEPVTKDLVRSASYLRRDLGLGGGDVLSTDGSRLGNLLCRPVARAAARTGRSDRYHVFAHRGAS